MFKSLFARKFKEDRLDRAVSHSHDQEQQKLIRGRAGKIIADQRAKALQAQSSVRTPLAEKS